MNKTFLKGLFLLTAAFAISTAQAANSSGDNQQKNLKIRTFKVDGRLVGVTEDYRMVAIVCNYSSADLVFPNSRGELNSRGYNASGRTSGVNAAPFRTITGPSMAALCGSQTGDFTLALDQQSVDVVAVAYSN